MFDGFLFKNIIIHGLILKNIAVRRSKPARRTLIRLYETPVVRIITNAALLLFVLAPPVARSQTVLTPSEKIALEPGKLIDRNLAGEEKHFFKVALSADQYARVTVEQRGIDLTLKLEAPGGETPENDSDPRKIGVEALEFTAQAAGDFTITVSAKQKNAARGAYRIKLEEIRPATEKDFALDEARRIYWQAHQLWLIDKYDDALHLIKRVVEIRERELGAAHPDFATALVMLANQYNDKGDYRTAEPIYLRALAIKEKALGKEDISLAAIFNNLGNLYLDLGDYVKAETAYERALEIRRKHLEPDHLAIANVLINLGNLSRRKGDAVKAAAAYERVLEIRAKSLGTDHPLVADILNNLGILFYENREFAKSETFLLRALRIREKIFEPDNPQVSQTVFNLSNLYAKTGDLQKSLLFRKRTIALIENSAGPDHPMVGMMLVDLAELYTKLGDYAQAEPIYDRAIAIRRKATGEFHPMLGEIYSGLAGLYALQGKIDRSISEQAHANAIAEYNTEANLATGSEREKLAYIKSLREYEDRTLTLGFQFAPASKEAARLSATFILQRKGRVLDAASDNLNALRQRFSKEDQALLDRLNETTKELAALFSENALSEEKQARVKALTEERERLETEITRIANGFLDSQKYVLLRDIQPLIPPGGALLEFTVYYPLNLRGVSLYDGSKPRYAVFVIGANELKWKDLGETKAIDDAVTGFRQALRDPKNKEVEKLGRALDERIMQPVRALLGDARHLLVSPDGELNLIPFEALVSERGRFLVEDYSFTYLTSGRDLLRLQTRRDSKSKPLVIGNPQFGEADLEQVSKTGAKSKTKRSKRRSVTAARELSGVYFAPLAGTETETRAIHEIFPESIVLSGAQATESALKKVTAPRILHIATHGFFLADTTEGGDLPVEVSNLNDAAPFENPLLRSGLALANANRRVVKVGDDGILTALEASGLNLWGTKLVVLSACDTGLGEVKNGEGVYGLRRAFVLAGAESMVMSLWAVRDFVTSELMSDYYRHLKAGKGRGAAWRAVQLEMLKRADRRHPFYWASFIQSGEWANLDGSR